MKKQNKTIIILTAIFVFVVLGFAVAQSIPSSPLRLTWFLGKENFPNENVNGVNLSNISCPSFINVGADKKDLCSGTTWAAEDGAKAAGTNVEGKTWAVGDKGPFTYVQAVAACAATGYHLPTVDELYSLAGIEETSEPKTEANSNFATSNNNGLYTYWSSTEYIDKKNNPPATGYARSVNFYNGTADNIIYSKTVGLNVRCVSSKFCGNGIVDPGEGCDGNNLGGLSCTSNSPGLNFLGGTLGCSSCALNTDACYKGKIVAAPAFTGPKYCTGTTTPCIDNNGCDSPAICTFPNTCNQICQLTTIGGTQLACKGVGTDIGKIGAPATSCGTGPDCKTSALYPFVNNPANTAEYNLNKKVWKLQESGGTATCVENGTIIPSGASATDQCATVLTGDDPYPCGGTNFVQQPGPWTYCLCG